MANIFEKMLLDDFLNNRNLVINIPIYQRNYDWDEIDVRKLMEDIIEFNDMFKNDVSEKYYLGNVITREEQDREDSEITNLILIDGQQRITTTILILCALRNEKLIPDDQVNKYIKVNSMDGKFKINRIHDEDAIRKILKNEIYKLDEEDKTRNVFLNYDFIVKWINKDIQKAQSLFESLKKIVIVDVKIPKVNETKVFETINSTGKKLSPADLIKAFVLFNSHNFSQTESKEIEIAFEKKIIEKLRFLEIDDDKTGDISDFFRYYISIVGKQQLVKRGSLDIFRKFKELHSDYRYDLLDEVVKMIDQIGRHAEIFNKINTFKYENHFNKLYKQILDSNSKTYYPLAHFLFMNYVTDLDNEAQMGKVMRIIAKISLFRNLGNLPDKTITQSVVTMYPDFVKYKNGVAGSIEEFEDFIDLIGENKNYGIPTFDEMVDQTRTLNHYSLNQSKTRNLLLATEVFLNKGLHGTPINITEKFDLEHVFPQSDTNWRRVKTPEEIIELRNRRDNIGNLTLLAKGLNIQAKNYTFNVKKGKIQEDTLRLRNYFDNVEDWTSHEIEKRSKWIVKTIFNHFNENREVLTPLPVEKTEKLKSVIKVEGVDEPNKKKPKVEINYKEYFTNLISKLEKVNNVPISMHTPSNQQWNGFSMKDKYGAPIRGAITARGAGNDRFLAITIDWDAEEKANVIHLSESSDDIAKNFTRPFEFKDTDKKGWGFVLNVSEDFDTEISDEVISNIVKSLREVYEVYSDVFPVEYEKYDRSPKFTIDRLAARNEDVEIFVNVKKSDIKIDAILKPNNKIVILPGQSFTRSSRPNVNDIKAVKRAIEIHQDIKGIKVSGDENNYTVNYIDNVEYDNPSSAITLIQGGVGGNVYGDWKLKRNPKESLKDLVKE